MALRRLLGCLAAGALAVCASTGCKDKGDAAKNQPTAADLDGRCVRLAKTCGDKDKHIEKIIDGCMQAGKKQVEKGCTDKVLAAYTCYEKELCGGAEKVWALDDLGVLAERHSKCVAERNAVRECVEKKAEGSAK